MKLYLKLGAIIVGIVVLLAIWLPNLIIDRALAKGDGSTIGGVLVKNLDEDAMEVAIQEAIRVWQDTPITVEGGGVTATVDPKMLVFDVASSVAEYRTLTDKPWFAFWEGKRTVHLPLQVIGDEQLIKQLESMGVWEAETTLNEVIAQASYLNKHSIEATVADTTSMEAERLALSIEQIPTNAKGVLALVNTLNDYIIAPNEPFSLLNVLGEKVEEANSEGVNFVASLIYHTVLQTEFEILERHAQDKKMDYLQQGLDAAVNSVLNKDLQFINYATQPTKLKLMIENDTLKVELLAQTKEKEITVRVSKDKIVQPRIITRYSKDLAMGQEEIIQNGQEGVRVEVYRSIVENGISKEELVSRDYYAPINRIVVQSSRQPDVSDGTSNTSNDADLQVDLDGDGLADSPVQPPSTNGNTSSNTTTPVTTNDPEIVYGYYDKGGNFVQTSP
ncbi:VanW family protein [Lysinibacillus sp. CD3-6]|uniref:VanW family protein n=1 Tax=Lysinibacillus sp. CD3-6 TaxID=2892541 RepID=UPI001173C5A5|nr:VanW family protein [Lysinibacillus sp. CD3-6]UED81535.1 VanW family protein [Lysinibacillus sp. CD3-6]